MVNVPRCVRRRLDWIIIFVWLQLMRFHRQKMKTFISFPFLFIIAQNDHSVLKIKASIFGKVSRSPPRILAVATELWCAPLRLLPRIFEFMTFCVTSLLSGQRTWTTWSAIQCGCHLYQNAEHKECITRLLSVFSVITKFYRYYFLPAHVVRVTIVSVVVISFVRPYLPTTAHYVMMSRGRRCIILLLQLINGVM